MRIPRGWEISRDKPPCRQSTINVNHPMHRDLYYWFLFNENAGTIAYDRTGKSLRSVLTTTDGNAVPWRPAQARISQSVIYLPPEYTDRWSLPDIPPCDDFTLIFEGYNVSQGGAFPCIIGYLADALYTHYILIYSQHANFGNSALFAIKVNNGTEITQTFTWAANEWAVLAVIRRSNDIEVYKNGQLLNSPSASGAGSATFTSGNIGVSIGDNNYSAGALSWIQLYTRALDAYELAWFNDAPFGTSRTPRLFYRMSQGNHILRRFTYMPTFSRLLTMQR